MDHWVGGTLGLEAWCAFFSEQKKTLKLASHGSWESRSDLYLFPGLGLQPGWVIHGRRARFSSPQK